MTFTEKSLAVVSGVLVIVLAVGAYFYVKQVEALSGAEAFSKSQDAEIAKEKQNSAAAQQRLIDRKREWDEREKQYKKQRAAIQTPAQAAAILSAFVEEPDTAPDREDPARDVQTKRAVVEVKAEDLPPVLRSLLPDAPSYAVMTGKASVELARATEDLKHANAQVFKLQKDNADLQVQLMAAINERDREKAKAVRWEQAAKGGTVVHRMTNAGKWMAAGAVVTCVFVCK